MAACYWAMKTGLHHPPFHHPDRSLLYPFFPLLNFMDDGGRLKHWPHFAHDRLTRQYANLTTD